MKTMYLFLIVLVAYIALAYFLFFFALTPVVDFDHFLEEYKPQPLKLYLAQPLDLRPHNEKTGYKTWYVSSIADRDYEQSFADEVYQALSKSLQPTFVLEKNKREADLTVQVEVKHFYGEYFRTVEAALWELYTGVALFLPRLVTDFIPYNHFAGRVAMDITLVYKNEVVEADSFDSKVIDTVCTYKRGSRDTAARLSSKAAEELEKIFGTYASYQPER